MYNSMKKRLLQTILAGVFLLLFVVLSVLTLCGVLDGFETAVYNLISKSFSANMTAAVKVITYGGSFIFLCSLIVLFVILPQTRKRFGWIVALTTIISAILNAVLKAVFRRPRPSGLALISESGFSFPSGHAQSSTACYIAIALLLLIYIRRREIGIPLMAVCIILSMIIGLSRIYLGVHYAGDVIAGWTFGVAIAIGVNALWQYISDRVSG